MIAVTVKCVMCKHEMTVGPEQRGELPMCPKCFSPMFAVSVESK